MHGHCSGSQVESWPLGHGSKQPPKTRIIFVFGSNLMGIHGKGSALYARNKYGAKLGVGKGRTGDAYAIPTKKSPYDLHALPLREIAVYVQEFLQYAREHPELEFHVVAIGTGNAGLLHEQVAPLFRGAPGNCQFPSEWEKYVT